MSRRIGTVTKVGSVIVGGVPTAIFNETIQRGQTAMLVNAAISDKIQRSDGITLTPKLTDTIQRGDVYRIPTITAAPADKIQRVDGPVLAPLQTTDKIQRGDLFTATVTYQTPGTYTIPAQATSETWELWGGGNSGGAG